MKPETETQRSEETGTETEAYKPGGKELVELCAALLEDDEFVANYVVKSEKVKRAVVDEYLRGISRTPPVMSRGVAALAPRPRAKTLEEAKKLCETYLGGI